MMRTTSIAALHLSTAAKPSRPSGQIPPLDNRDRLSHAEFERRYLPFRYNLSLEEYCHL
jgi:hypothetical protein